ncbi:MAG: hypothetical protein RR058_08550 [Oscillospiraceae bacterium]
MEDGFAIVLSLVFLGIAIAINCLIAGEFANIAEEKGFERRRYWHFCFWLGFVGYAIVIALPNRKIAELSKALAGLKVAAADGNPSANTSKPAANYLPEL